jgi:hypothetical protein
MTPPPSRHLRPRFDTARFAIGDGVALITIMLVAFVVSSAPRWAIKPNSPETPLARWSPSAH